MVAVLCRFRSGVPSFADLTVRRVDCLSGRSFAGQILGMCTSPSTDSRMNAVSDLSRMEEKISIGRLLVAIGK